MKNEQQAKNKLRAISDFLSGEASDFGGYSYDVGACIDKGRKELALACAIDNCYELAAEMQRLGDELKEQVDD